MSAIRDVAMESDILNIASLASRPLPNRPDGTIVCVLYSSVEDMSLQAINMDFERLAEVFPDCIFLRCYKEYEGSSITFATRQVVSFPTFEYFYKGTQVARTTGPNLNEVKEKIRQFGFIVSKTDLFSDSASSWSKQGIKEPQDPTKLAWDREADNAASTTMRFIPGGMGQQAAEIIREKGSTLDSFQAARRGGDNEGVQLPGGGSGGAGGAYEQGFKFWKERFEEIVKDGDGKSTGKNEQDNSGKRRDVDADSIIDNIWDSPDYK
ncbi:hypothetical protein GUITHDRAFT_99193 [Guillardia theta CCMP2712]|uniref:Thioredoxin domain-containing protein n=1 Tax=Guillardia theta (strain CCMP2712) TaxID=905079 RepID=L1K4M4_GUITC|nr:hypothetical protein GUITHDRAFT_99193 [Guillardia theta CCMP2712]EKX55415.1 hypothetical protein GUITHDRAFT_99193 [Guillardia theta CCMP2712]|eukprot:XP_005842395.1 hypothetical protein GUITHDRAFT_99193 [Guillardia theta CCMP2712]